VKYAFIEKHKTTHPVRRLCTLLSVSAAGYYEWIDRGISKHARRDNEIMKRIFEIHSLSRKTYGSPRIHAEFVAAGERVGRNRIARLMRNHGVQGRMRRAFRCTTNSSNNDPIAPNILGRKFNVTEPNTHWVGDVTYIPTREGWLYLAIVLDLASRMIVGWSMSHRIKSDIVKNAISAAILRRKPKRGILFHSDRGSTYTADDFRKLLEKNKIIASMSGKGQCWDNAVAESFFGSMKSELGDPIWETRATARAAIFEYIEIWYNRQRRHSTLGYLSPQGYEQQLAQTA
jgi:putative transposase